MDRRLFFRFVSSVALVVICLLWVARVVDAQGTQATQATQTTQMTLTTTPMTQTTQMTMTTNTTNTTGNAAGVAGVIVDPSGVLRTRTFMDQRGQLMWQKMAAARAQLKQVNPKVAAPTALRKISLNRLEAALKKQLDAGQKPSEEMKYLAGLTRVQFVFYYPETKDIVIAGPAEGWMADWSGRVRGANSLRPVVELDDLVTALRAFPPQGKAANVISCSIDPTQEGLQRMQEFLREFGRRATPGDTGLIVDSLRNSLGMEKITIKGVPASTHFAQVLVEADYRMKLIGIGVERPPVKQLIAWIDSVRPTAVAKNALQRWFFVPEYECVKVTADDLAMELVGNGVKLVGADEVVAADGTRAESKAVDLAGRAFTEGFTKKYAELAAVAPVYAQLRNCIDLAVAAAFIQSKDYYGKAGWKLPLFGSESDYPVQTLSAPQEVETVVAAVWRGNTLMTPVGGGVNIQARKALAPANVLHDEDGKIGQVHDKIELKNLAEGQWWWD